MSDATVLTVSLSVLIWFATDKESLEDVLGSQTATAAPRPRGTWHHVLSQPSAAEPAPRQSPRLQPGVVLLLESSQICSAVHSLSLFWSPWTSAVYAGDWSCQVQKVEKCLEEMLSGACLGRCF